MKSLVSNVVWPLRPLLFFNFYLRRKLRREKWRRFTFKYFVKKTVCYSAFSNIIGETPFHSLANLVSFQLWESYFIFHITFSWEGNSEEKNEEYKSSKIQKMWKCKIQKMWNVKSKRCENVKSKRCENVKSKKMWKCKFQ